MQSSKPLPESIHSYIDQFLDNTSPKRMEGWCTPEKATYLASHVLASRPVIAVEIGVYAGRSLFSVALAMKENGIGRVLGIDPWSPSASVAGFEADPANRDWWSRLDHSSIMQQCILVKNELGLNNVHLFRGTALQASLILEFSQSEPFIDMLHIDGNHSEESALFDVNHFIPMVRPGGTIAFDDCDWDTTKKAQARLSELCDPVTMVGNCGIFQRKEVCIDGGSNSLDRG